MAMMARAKLVSEVLMLWQVHGSTLLPFDKGVRVHSQFLSEIEGPPFGDEVAQSYYENNIKISCGMLHALLL